MSLLLIAKPLTNPFGYSFRCTKRDLRPLSLFRLLTPLLHQRHRQHGVPLTRAQDRRPSAFPNIGRVGCHENNRDLSNLMNPLGAF